MRKLLSLLALLLALTTFIQCGTKTTSEVKEEAAYRPLLLFTGSSSVRIWKSLPTDFPDYRTINTGFGGSQFSDLIEEKETAIFPYDPDVLFIYEGDNDLALGKTPDQVILDADSILTEIRQRLPETQVVFISAKPSPSRWKFKEAYEDLNLRIMDLAKADSQVHFVDLWTPMLKENGRVSGDIFIEDSLHMNASGYQIWQEYIEHFLSNELKVLRASK